MKKLLFLLLLIPCVSYAADTATPYGGLKFNEEDTGYVAEISAVDAGTYYGFINASSSEVISGFTFNEDDTNGDYIELTGSSGNYTGIGGMSFGIAAPSGEDVHCDIFVNDTHKDFTFERVIGVGGQIGSAILVPDIVALTTGDKIRLKCRTDGTNETIEIYHVGLIFERVLAQDSDSANDHTHSSSQINYRHPGTRCYGCPLGK